MKRAPKPGEPTLAHKTVNTGHVQRIAICDENFNPAILAKMRTMRTQPLMGYRLDHVLRSDQGGIDFRIVRDDDAVSLSENWVRRSGQDVLLDTAIRSDDMTTHEALMLADLEQFAALMLLAQSDKEQK